MAAKSSPSTEKQQQPYIKVVIVTVAVLLSLFLLYAMTFGIWWMMMPKSDYELSSGEVNEARQAVARQLETDVRVLSEKIGERNMHTAGSLEAAVQHIESRLTEIGYAPEQHTYEVRWGSFSGQFAVNLIAELPGIRNPDEIIIIGAHYDSVRYSPGANDNASGVAVLLALADYFEKYPQARTVRFIAFTNEELPFFLTSNMGSYAYAEQSRNRGENIKAVMALDGLGYYSSEPDSQYYPLPGLGRVYPRQADFIAFVTRLRDIGLMHQAVSAFRREAAIASEAAALPGFIPGVYWSDHWSFWKHGYSAFLVTDTLPFRDPEYHTDRDTADRLNYRKMTLLVEGLRSVVKELGNN